MYNFKKLKYKYHVKTGSENINNIRDILVFDLVINDDNILFYTNDLSILGNNINYEIIQDRDDELNRIYKKYVGLLLGMVITIVILFFNSLRYNEIIFTEKVNDKESIIEYIEEKTSNFLNIRFLNEDVLDINVDIRNKFTNLEWISIEKIGTDIYVSTVRKNNIQDNTPESDIGHLVSSTDAIVKLVNVKTGRLLVLQNQFISKGDKLVSANLNEIYEGQKPIYVRSSGIILGEYEDSVEYKIPVKDYKTKPTGKIDSYTSINILGFKIAIGRSNSFKRHSDIIDEKFSVLGLITLNKVQEVEKSDIILGNTKETAILKVEDSIYNNFEVTRVHDNEKIINITIDKVIEEEDYFYVYAYVHQIKNIAVFKEFIPEE